MKSIINRLKNMIKLIKHKKEWRKRNTHNHTTAESEFNIERVEVGKHTYGPLNIKFYDPLNEFISIGSFCSIAANVKILGGGEHRYDTVSTFPFQTYIGKRDSIEAISKGPITIEDDVWIGHSSIILSGVNIGQGAIVGAGSIVSKDIPPYAIYAQGKIIKKRFDDDTIEKLLKLNYANINEDDIKKNMSLLTNKLNENFFESAFYLDHLKEE